MWVLIITLGTRGDVQPYAVLAAGEPIADYSMPCMCRWWLNKRAAWCFYRIQVSTIIIHAYMLIRMIHQDTLTYPQRGSKYFRPCTRLLQAHWSCTFTLMRTRASTRASTRSPPVFRKHKKVTPIPALTVCASTVCPYVRLQGWLHAGTM